MITPTLKNRGLSFLGELQNNSDTCSAFYSVCGCVCVFACVCKYLDNKCSGVFYSIRKVPATSNKDSLKVICLCQPFLMENFRYAKVGKENI